MELGQTDAFLDTVIQSATVGEARDYLIGASERERTMRRMFRELIAYKGDCESATRVHCTFRYLNGFYRTRYSLTKLERASEVAHAAVERMSWWGAAPPVMLECSKSDVHVISCFIQQTLATMSLGGLNQPYSLLTKWMHFCFPESFVIYDWQATLSVQAWSHFVFDLGDERADQFRADMIGNPNATGYAGMLNFYRLCWRSASADQRQQLNSAASRLSTELGETVSVIDIIDKVLWIAKGDPRRMGLLRKGGS